MTDATGRETLAKGIDLDRLTRPQADAFRHIAEALGARYAGDEAEVEAKPEGAPPSPLVRAGNGRGGARHDAAAAALLETLPLPIIVTDETEAVFLNRAARTLLGFRTPADLDAAGGLATLIGSGAAPDGSMPVADASGEVFLARVEMTPVDWAGSRAILVSLQPLGLRAGPAPSVPDARSDALHALLSANPDPVAIITRGGYVETANVAYERLAGDDDLRLETRVDASALAEILQAVAAAFATSEGEAATTGPITVGTASVRVSAAVVAESELVCLVFHEQAATGSGPASEAALPAEALERAVARARRLLGDTVRIEIGGDRPSALEAEYDAETERFFRAFLIAVGVPAQEGTVLVVERRGMRYQVTLAPGGAAPLAETARSARLVMLALEAGLALAPVAGGTLTIAPVLTRPVAIDGGAAS